MNRQAFVVTGLGFGDEGKGTVTDWLTVQHNAHTIVRTGGPQALHRVVTSGGREHVFSQFGSGTLRGAATHLSRHMLVAPHALLREGTVLQEKPGCANVFSKLTVHKDALVVTPFQGVTGRVRELLRGVQRRGTVGVGVGETVRDAEALGSDALRMRDLYSPSISEKLTALWRYKVSQYEHYADRASGLPEPIGNRVREQLSLLLNDNLLQETIAEFSILAKLVSAVDDAYVAKEILAKSGTIIYEGSQGVLLDREYGFHPYTTKVRATPATARELLAEGGYTGRISSLGIVRSYATRHGYGPFVTEDHRLADLLPDARNQKDPWQGAFRIGHFDAVASRYANAACGHQAFDGLVVTCLDRTAALDTWSICTAYRPAARTQHKNITDLTDLATHDRTEIMSSCRPMFTMHRQGQLSRERWQQLQIEEISTATGLPVYAVSAGATETDKYLTNVKELIC